MWGYINKKKFQHFFFVRTKNKLHETERIEEKRMGWVLTRIEENKINVLVILWQSWNGVSLCLHTSFQTNYAQPAIAVVLFLCFFFSHNIILITLSSLTIPSSLVEKTQFALSGFSNFQISQNIIKYQIYLNKESIRNETKEMTIMQGALVFVLFNLNSFTRLTPYLQCDVRIN